MRTEEEPRSCWASVLLGKDAIHKGDWRPDAAAKLATFWPPKGATYNHKLLIFAGQYRFGDRDKVADKLRYMLLEQPRPEWGSSYFELHFLAIAGLLATPLSGAALSWLRHWIALEDLVTAPSGRCERASCRSKNPDDALRYASHFLRNPDRRLSPKVGDRNLTHQQFYGFRALHLCLGSAGIHGIAPVTGGLRISWPIVVLRGPSPPHVVTFAESLDRCPDGPIMATVGGVNWGPPVWRGPDTRNEASSLSIDTGGVTVQRRGDSAEVRYRAVYRRGVEPGPISGTIEVPLSGMTEAWRIGPKGMEPAPEWLPGRGQGGSPPATPPAPSEPAPQPEPDTPAPRERRRRIQDRLDRRES